MTSTYTETTLEQKIRKFLAEPKKTEDDGWPEVKPREIAQLYDIVDELIRAKWEPDCDGDVAVRVNLTALPAEYLYHHLPVPRTSNKSTHQQLAHALSMAHGNLGIAVEVLRQITTDIQFKQEDEECKAISHSSTQ